MSKDRKALIALAAELNEKRDAKIEKPNKMSEEDLADAILAATDDGKDVKQLSKLGRGTLAALVASRPDTSADDDADAAGDADDASGDDAALPEDLTSREAQNIAAHDMNTVMGIEPQIDTSLPDKEFFKALKKAANMASGTDNFSDYTWKVFEANKIGPERVVMGKDAKKVGKVDKAEKGKADKTEKAAKGEKKEKSEKKAKESKGPGVIATIQTFLDERVAAKKAFTRDEILALLKKTFPERDPDAMIATIKTQIPGKMSKDKGYAFEKDGDKFKVTKK